MHAGMDGQRAAKRAGHVVAQCVTQDDTVTVSNCCNSDPQKDLTGVLWRPWDLTRVCRARASAEPLVLFATSCTATQPK